MISAMLQYIQHSPDCFHAVEELRQRLLREGYTELRPGRGAVKIYAQNCLQAPAE